MEIAILILTHNEESHLPRVLDNVKNIGDVFVVDSYSTDRTTEILDQYGIKYYQRKFDYHYKQANHGIDIINNGCKWVSLHYNSSDHALDILEKHKQYINW